MKTDNKPFKQLALIGSTASGKTSLSIRLAKKMNAHILSLDSLAIYKEINIVSAKPTIEEQEGITHFGLDYIYPHEDFDVNIYIALYKEVHALCQKEGKNLIIVGGTGFYLKMLIEGISRLPTFSHETHQNAQEHLQSLQETYDILYSVDSSYMSHIKANDRYRIEKALLIYLETGLTPTVYFTKNPPQPTITESLDIYQIIWDRETLRKRIALRTEQMVDNGLIDEICMLEKKYGRSPNAMQSIGIKETLTYLDGIYDKKMLIEKITTNTARLAKRQNTFNNSQFDNVIRGSVEELGSLLL